MAFKGIVSLVMAWRNFRLLKARRVMLSDLSDARLRSLTTYYGIVALIGAIGSGVLLIPILSNLETMKYIFIGLFIAFASGAIEDFTAWLTHRWERVRRQQLSER